MPRDRFAPRSQSRYFEKLLRELSQVRRSGFYLGDDLRARTEIDGLVILGTIQCEGGIRVEIEERLRFARISSWFRRRGAALPVELVFYRYNAVLGSRGSIFRYNSPHSDHRRYHHVHRFDVLGTGEQTVQAIREREVPSIREVLVEAEEWYWANVGRPAE